MHIYKLARLLNSLQAATFKEDFDAERKDRETAHSKMAEMETQLQENFRKLESSHTEVAQLRVKLKETESMYQAKISQSKYHIGDKNKEMSMLREEKRKLEVSWTSIQRRLSLSLFQAPLRQME